MTRADWWLQDAAAAWEYHRRTCDACRRVSNDKPGTFGLTCLRGASHLKELLEAARSVVEQASRRQGRAAP